MRILRIQNNNGIGPYVDGPDELFDQLNTDTDRLPTPETDDGINRFPYSHEYCGFADHEQLCAWFTEEELILLDAYGYRIVELDAEVTAIGEYQVLFTKSA